MKTTSLLFVFATYPFLSHAETVTGKAALSGWEKDRPGLTRRISVADLPPPFNTPSAGNGPKVVGRPDGAAPRVPEGFKVTEYAADLKNPRKIVTAPNGDIFVAESEANRVTVLRDTDGDGVANSREIFAENLSQPFGLAFYPTTGTPKYLYVANTGSVVRFTYNEGQLKAEGEPETIVQGISAGGRLRGGGHWTRDIVFSKDDKKLYVSIGSKSNVDDNEEENQRARIFEFDADGKNERAYATGIRNPVGLAIDPTTGALWASVNERDGLGDDLVPDYVTKVKEDGFYGWPWYYMGGEKGGINDPRQKGKRPELQAKVITPDVLFVPHSASLCLTYVNSKTFPAAWKNGFFAAHHGSWNRADRIGSKVVFIPAENGKATGAYIDFMDGFVLDNEKVWGRLVGVTFDKTGALLVSDDGANKIWRVTYQK